MNNSITCYCGSIILNKSLYKHLKTKKHLKNKEDKLKEITDNMMYLDEIKDTLCEGDYIEICNQLKKDYNEIKNNN